MPRKSAAPGLGLLVLFGIAACGEDSFSKHPGGQVFKESGCIRCHAASLTGTAKGPSLQGLQANWTQESLILYLSNPREYIRSDERLKKMAEQYNETMPRIRMSDESREQLAKFLLESL